MNISATIFNSILFGDLAPWRPENTNESKFREILNNQVRINHDDPAKYFTALSKALNEHLINLDIDHLPNSDGIANLAKYANLQTNFSKSAIPPYFNKASEFYQYLINNENIRICSAIVGKVNDAENSTDAEYQVCGLLRNLENVIEHIAEKTQDDKVSTYVLKALKISVFRLYETIKLSFPDFIGNDALTEYEVINFITPDFESQKNIENSASFFINQFLLTQIDSTKNEVSTANVTKVSAPPPVQAAYHSFTYINLQKRPEYIKDLFSSLKTNNFIDQSTDWNAFKKVFSGSVVTTPVIWTGYVSDLYYFIKMIYSVNKSVKDLKQHQWEVTCKCFVKPDGSLFDRANLKIQKKPVTTAAIIEKAANLLK